MTQAADSEDESEEEDEEEESSDEESSEEEEDEPRVLLKPMFVPKYRLSLPQATLITW